MSRGWTARTVSHALSVWRGFTSGGCCWAVAKSLCWGEGAPLCPPASSGPQRRPSRGLGRTGHGRSRVRGSGPADEVVRARDAVVLELLYGTGMRISELVSLDVRESVQSLDGSSKMAAM